MREKPLHLFLATKTSGAECTSGESGAEIEEERGQRDICGESHREGLVVYARLKASLAGVADWSLKIAAGEEEGEEGV